MLKKRKIFELVKSLCDFDFGKLQDYNYTHYGNYDEWLKSAHGRCIGDEYVKYNIYVLGDGQHVRISKIVEDEDCNHIETELIFGSLKNGQYTYHKQSTYIR